MSLPTIFVHAHYPVPTHRPFRNGGNPLEEQINGVEDMLYMESVYTTTASAA